MKNKKKTNNLYLTVSTLVDSINKTTTKATHTKEKDKCVPVSAFDSLSHLKKKEEPKPTQERFVVIIGEGGRQAT